MPTTLAGTKPMSGLAPNGTRSTPAGPRPDVPYEWEILIEAPFAFDFFKMVKGIFRLPTPRPRASATDAVARPSRRRWVLHVVAYNIGRIALILGMIPFLMLAFSYVATVPFLLMRGLGAAVGTRAVTIAAGLGLIAALLIPVAIILQWFQPNWYRDSYQKSKVELFNIGIAAGLFLASGMLEILIASPDLPLRSQFESATPGGLDSTPQWTLFFADQSMNVLFANLPRKIFGSISEIKIKPAGSEVSLGLLRLLLVFGFVTLIRLMAMKLCISKRELFWGTEAELRGYLQYCGKARAQVMQRVVPIDPSEHLVIWTRLPEPGEMGEAGPATVAGSPPPPEPIESDEASGSRAPDDAPSIAG